MELRIPEELEFRAATWHDLPKEERRDLCRRLRAFGLSYSEICRAVPVAKGTLSGWVRDIDLSERALERIKTRTSSAGQPRDTQWKRRLEVDRLRANARAVAPTYVGDPFWVAGVLLYWGEGAKTTRRLSVTNADDRLLRLFMRWCRRYLDARASFSASLNLHADNDGESAHQFWTSRLNLGRADFTKAFVKPDGSGQRKNRIEYGVCRVVMRRSSDGWITTDEWIRWLGEQGWCAHVDRH